MNDVTTNNKNALSKARTRIIVLTILVMLLLMIAVTIAVGYLFRLLRFGNESVFYYILHDSSATPVIVVLNAIIALSGTRLLFYNKRQNTIIDKDDRGVHYMGDSTYGSSRWMREDEIEKAFEVSDIANTSTILYGQLGEGGKKVVGFKQGQGAIGTKSTIIIASSGSGKSFTFIRNSIVQSVRRKTSSFVVTDPSGELYTDLSSYCRKSGMDVHVLNLADPSYSEFWDFLEETVNPLTGRIDSTRLNEFATIFMENSPNIEKDFWYKSALNLLKTVIAYTAYCYEESVLNKYRALYKRLSNSSDDSFIKETKNSFVTFNYCRDVLLKTAKKNGFDIYEIAALIKEINDNPSYEFNINQVYQNLLHFSDFEKELQNIPTWHPAYTNYLVYATNDTDNVRKSALQGTQLCFDVFSDGKLRNALSHKGIHIGDINTKRSAYFVIISDKSTAAKPIASLFFSFLLKDAQDIYDRNAQISKEQGTENPCLNLDMILDEFFSIGVIQGSPEAAGISFSNARKRGICFYLAIQSYSQIEALYGRYIKDVILGNCSTLLYMGGNDEATCKFISEYASGDATILTESHSEHGLLHVPNSDTTVRTDHRFLLTVDEARRWKDKVLVVKQGELPLQLNPLPWTDQPCYRSGDAKPNSIYSTIEELECRLESEKRNRVQTDIETYFMNKTMNLISSNPSFNKKQDDLSKSEELEEEMDFISSDQLRKLINTDDKSKNKESKINF